MSVQTVVHLVTHTSQASTDVEAALQSMQDALDAYGLTGIAIAAVDRAGFTHTCFVGGEDVSTLIGGIERVKHRILAETKMDD